MFFYGLVILYYILAAKQINLLRIDLNKYLWSIYYMSSTVNTVEMNNSNFFVGYNWPGKLKPSEKYFKMMMIF